jgi:sulfite exporter TauE/SafE/copper chaperone CopZ
MPTEKQTFYVSGMHCKSCEFLIENKLKEYKGVKEVSASTSESKVDIKSHGSDLSIEKLNNLFKNNGYTFSDKPKSKISDIINAVLIVLLIWSINYTFGINRILPKINVGTGTGGGSMFLLGLAAGVSSCAALSGALLLSLVKKWKEKGTLGSFLFVIGRVISYTLAGVLLGYAGTLFVASQTFLAIFTILISLFMIVLALQMLGYGIFAIFQPSRPKFIDDEVAEVTKGDSNKSMWGGFLLGMSTLLLPCGFTLTAAGLAASSAKPLQGSLTMLLFALGSSIVLFIIGVSGHKLVTNPKIGDTVSKVVGVLILFFAINSITTQISISNFFVRSGNDSNNSVGITTSDSAKQLIKMNASTNGYSLDSFKVKVNQPVRWEITDTGTSGCTNAVIAPGLFDGQVALTRGQTSVKEFTPTKTGTFRFSCWMGMINGTIEVTN